MQKDTLLLSIPKTFALGYRVVKKSLRIVEASSSRSPNLVVLGYVVVMIFGSVNVLSFSIAERCGAGLFCRHDIAHM